MNLVKPYFDQYQVNLKGIFVFEAQSLIGRLFFNSKPKLKNNGSIKLLNLGCSSNIIDGWTNADFYNLRTLLLPWTRKYKLRPNWFLDLRYPIKCDDNYWDGIFTEHTLEHLYPTHAIRLLHELFRILKPGKWLRVTVPDMEKYVQFYNGNSVDSEFEQRWSSGCEAIRSLTQDYLHCSAWDRYLLSKVLKDCGFFEIKVVAYNEGSDSRLLIDRKVRKWETLYIEAQKPYLS